MGVGGILGGNILLETERAPNWSHCTTLSTAGRGVGSGHPCMGYLSLVQKIPPIGGQKRLSLSLFWYESYLIVAYPHFTAMHLAATSRVLESPVCSPWSESPDQLRTIEPLFN